MALGKVATGLSCMFSYIPAKAFISWNGPTSQKNSVGKQGMFVLRECNPLMCVPTHRKGGNGGKEERVELIFSLEYETN